MLPRSVAGVGVAALALTACGGDDSDGGVRVGEAKVAAKEKALADAKSAATEAATAFCDDSRTYIVGLDAYADVLRTSAPTVGDVRAAGSDLTEPRDEAMNAAQAAVDAQQQVVVAEQELADAEAALAAANQSGEPSSSPSSAGVTSPPPLAPTSTVARVEQADAEFQAAVSGITDDTPLAQAAQQFNAAAFALEVSWLRLFADAGCLTGEQEKQATRAVHDYTLALQQSLAAAGYYSGEIDGVYGPSTVEAVEQLQESHGLPVTGTVDKATNAALRTDLEEKGGAAAQAMLASTAAVQQTLKLAGFWDGPVDGEWTPALTEALKAFQTDLGVKPTGTVDAATVAAFEDALAAVQEPPQSSPSPSPPDAGSTAPAETTATEDS